MKKRDDKKLNVLSPEEKASKRIAILTKAYIHNEAARQQVATAIMRKRPRSQGEIKAPMTKFSFVFSVFAHGTSIIIALPFIAAMLAFGLKAIGYQVIDPLFTFLIGSVLLIAFEWGQSVTLNQVFDNYYNDSELPIEAGIIALLMSSFSIGSSGYSAYHFLGGSQYVIVGVGVSLLVEMLIIYCNFYRHRYEHNTMLEATMVNDLLHNEDKNPIYPAIGTNYKEAHFKEHYAGIEQGNKAPVETAIIHQPTAKEIHEIGAKVSKPYVQKQTAVTAKKLTTIGVAAEIGWSEVDVKKYVQRYGKTIREQGETYARMAQYNYFVERQNNFSKYATGGFIPVVDSNKRYDWFDENFPGESKRLKNLPKKTRKTTK